MRKLKNLLISIFILFLILVPVVTAGTAYIVKPGDSLSKIASRFGVTVQEIVDANHIEDPNVVVVGMELTIPDGESAAVDNAQEPAATEIPAAQAEVSPAAEAATSITQETDAGSTIPGTYVVAAGDSLSKIAAMFGTVYKVLADLNGIASPYRIYAGQILNIPGQQNVEAPDQAAADTAPSAAAETAVQPVVKPSVTSLSAPIVRETAVSIPTYNYQQGFIPTVEGDSVYPYPYPRLDFSKVSGPQAKSYKALVLENGYVSVTVLPELGGRVYSLKDKATGRELLYQNPVIKPTSWGFREWWLAAGGIEWSFPVPDRGLNEWRPWTYSTMANSIIVSDVDDRTGMEVGPKLSLDADHSYLIIQPWARNLSSSPQSYQLWLNGMPAPGGNTVSG